jgi:hypothetical protein
VSRQRATLQQVHDLQASVDAAERLINQQRQESLELRTHTTKVQDALREANGQIEARDRDMKATIDRYEEALKVERERVVKQNDIINSLKILVRNGVKV